MGHQLFISAGEASGEHYGALLIQALKRQLAARSQTAAFFGMGSDRMADAGLERLVRSEEVAVMGITEVVRHLPRIYRAFRKLKQAAVGRRPDVAILIDFPDIHFKLARQFHRLGIPVIFFVSPQLWAWKKRRIRLVQRYVTRMLVIFPFEEAYYRERGVEAEFVGHPLADLPLPTVSREEFAAENGLDPDKTWIGLLPGSRGREIQYNLPEMIRAAILLFHQVHREQADPELEFIVPLAPTLTAAERLATEKIVGKLQQNLAIRLVNDLGAEGPTVPALGGARAALFHARASVVASGTATVEAALMGNPFVVVYRVSPLTYAIARHVVTVPHVAMANLIAGARVVPELIQNDCTALKIVQHIAPLLPDGAPRESMKRELSRVGALLRTRHQGREKGAIDRVAAITIELLETASPAGGESARNRHPGPVKANQVL